MQKGFALPPHYYSPNAPKLNNVCKVDSNWYTETMKEFNSWAVWNIRNYNAKLQTLGYGKKKKKSHNGKKVSGLSLVELYGYIFFYQVYLSLKSSSKTRVLHILKI